MSLKTQHRIYLALFIAVVLGCGLYFIGREATPLGWGTTTQTFWADNLDDQYGSAQWTGTTLAQNGVVLSRLNLLPVGNFSGSADNLTIASTGKVYWSSGATLFVYDTSQNIIERVPLPQQDSSIDHLVIAPDDHVYGAIHDFEGGLHENLVAYDPTHKQWRDLGTPISGTRTIEALTVGTDRQLYGVARLRDSDILFSFDPLSTAVTVMRPPIAGKSILDLTAGKDGWLYGVAYSPGDLKGSSTVFALEPQKGTIFTQEIEQSIDSLTPRIPRGLYLSAGRRLWSFNAVDDQLAPLPLSAEVQPFFALNLATPSNDQLYGYGTHYKATRSTYRFLFTYTPSTGLFEQVEVLNGGNWIDTLATGGHGEMYAILSEPIGSYTFLEKHYLASFNPNIYATFGTVQSDLIQPISQVLTHTQVGVDNASVQSLTCDGKGRVYGVKSDSSNHDWLFWYDPETPDHINRAVPDVPAEDKLGFMHGTAIVALDGGRLVGGTNSGHLFIYTPANNTTLDLGQPLSGTNQFFVLTLAHNGLIYGSTSSYNQARLFTLDPATNTITDITPPITPTYAIRALTTSADGRLYLGTNKYFIIYEPATQQTNLIETPNCQIQSLATGANGYIYAGCSDRLLMYNPTDNTLRIVGQVAGEIRSLFVGDDQRLYGSIYNEYTNRMGAIFRNSKLLAYDTMHDHLIDLGIALPYGPFVLTACPNGILYVGTNTTNSNYMGPAYLFAFRTDCTSGPVGSWDRLTWEADTPPNTNLTVDVLDEKGSVLLNQVSNGGSLQSIDARQHPAIRLRANLSTTDLHVTPVLKRWRVDYTFACQK